ncbi:MAG TPA: gliding motility-associated C-terminal domain-containing protein, partial [Saprospiraceae bacterium]|nr:gliding motility-associated C-terminal domain-containing protein [Saprospiraceae bacterium]
LDGCDSMVITETTLFPLPQLKVEVTSDFNGFDISCFGESDGSAIANVTGASPFQYIWSTTSTDQSITGLSAGIYAVTVTDANSCITEGSVELLYPPPFSISFVVSQPDCFSNSHGSITVEQTGGIAPVRYSIDGINYQSSNIFPDLSGGTYEITAFDANDCEVKEIIWLNVPLMVNVDLGDDLIILPGDTSVINAIVNVPYDSLSSVVWNGLMNPNCPTCLSQPVAPIITTTYSVTVETSDGCNDEDVMTLFLLKDTDVYVPNIFSPNSDNINDRLVINAGASVKKISSLSIYDRWGNMVFAANDFLPDDLNSSWDGKMKGKQVNPGVFAYKMIVEFKDGRSEIRFGDVTVVK